MRSAWLILFIANVDDVDYVEYVEIHIASDVMSQCVCLDSYDTTAAGSQKIEYVVMIKFPK